MAYPLGSLAWVLEQVLHPDHQYLIIDCKNQIHDLLERTRYFLDFLQDPRTPEIQGGLRTRGFMDFLQDPRTPEVRVSGLKNQIKDAASRAEDIILTHISDLILAKSTSSLSSWLDLKYVMEEFDSINKVIKEEIGIFIPDIDPSLQVTKSLPICSKKKLVGLNDQLYRLKNLVTEQQSTLLVIAVFGIRGMGKTTLVRELYNDFLNNKLFNSIAWITIAQEYNAKNTLLAILSCLKELTNEMSRETDEKLEERVKEKLKGRRYLFVFDNICNNEIWAKVRRFFPDENNGSRIILITRELDVAYYATSRSHTYKMYYMSEAECWELLSQNACVQGIPPDLEKFGYKIASICNGHPLLTAVIGGLLATCISSSFWRLVQDEMKSALR